MDSNLSKFIPSTAIFFNKPPSHSPLKPRQHNERPEGLNLLLAFLLFSSGNPTMSSLPPPSSMDSPIPSTPPYHRSPDPRLRSRTPSRLAVSFDDDHTETHASPVATPPSRKKPTASPSPHHLSIHPCSPISLQELLLFSPSPHRRPRPRLVAEEKLDQAVAHRKKGKSRAAAAAASPRNVRRSRRRLEKEIVREERELGLPEDDVGRARKRRQSRPKATQKERLSLVVSIPSPGPLPSML